MNIFFIAGSKSQAIDEVLAATKIENINWKKVSLGNSFGLGVDVDNKIYSCGRNLSSQLGLGKPTTFVNFTSPNLLLGDIEYITAGDQQAGIINIDGKLRMIGSNDQGQLGTGASPFNYPRELDWSEIQSDIKKVRVTFTETQILDSNGNLWAYGDNDYGQLGRGIANTAAENFIANKVTDVQGQDNSSSNLYSTGLYASENEKYILKSLGILIDGEYREHLFDEGVYRLTQSYLTSPSSYTFNENIYCYNFCLDTKPFSLQPCGAVNLSKYYDNALLGPGSKLTWIGSLSFSPSHFLKK